MPFWGTRETGETGLSEGFELDFEKCLSPVLMDDPDSVLAERHGRVRP
jgi:hypothetical protein